MNHKKKETEKSVPQVTVLLSTYNGEKFLKDQLDSIFHQIDVCVYLIVRDDGSKDCTMDILKEYQFDHSNMKIIKAKKNLGACGSFFDLMAQENHTEYYALADQDDIWDQDKLKKAILMLDRLPGDKPAMYYSNLRIVDENNVFIRNSHSQPHIAVREYSFLSDTLPTGCTIVYNRCLSQIISEKRPSRFSMHDTWLYCVCSLFGNIVYDFTPHINYRQHGSNAVGTAKRNISIARVKREWKYIFDWRTQPRYYDALELLREFGTQISDKDRLKILEIVNYKKSFRNMLCVLIDQDLKPGSRYRQIRFQVKVLLKNI